MAEAIAFGASVIAFLQVADRVIGLCKHYIETIRDAPHDLRIILIEISALKAILENLDFLTSLDPHSVSKAVRNLGDPNGTLAVCGQALGELEKLFPEDHVRDSHCVAPVRGRKRLKLCHSLEALAWPLKENRARKLLDQILRYKTTITLALSAESR
jgi:hypothetical protein